ncbi:hypothetical protein MMC14_001557 [Varicellaria rhodocarpa]|nr:hypothetical protein [Varicellaria rhodocarpa]
MHSFSITKALTFGLLAVAPFTTALNPDAAAQEVSKRYVGGATAYAANIIRAIAPALEARHHTEAQIAAKKAAAAKGKHTRDVLRPMNSGHGIPRRTNKREPHHTEAQIAAKKAAAAKATTTKGKHARDVPAPDEFGPWDSTEDEFGSWVDKREAHHTEAQIAAKEAKAKAAKGKSARDIEEREAHHTEAQIAAKKAAANKKKNSRDIEEREAHHTEAQIAAKEAKARKGTKSNSN